MHLLLLICIQQLDDWPGGIQQKYVTIRTMLIEMMKSLEFRPEELDCRNYVGEYGKDDAVGIWRDREFTICCLPTSDSIPILMDMQKIDSNNETFVLVNQQFFLGQNIGESEDSRSYLFG